MSLNPWKLKSGFSTCAALLFPPVPECRKWCGGIMPLGGSLPASHRLDGCATAARGSLTLLSPQRRPTNDKTLMLMTVQEQISAARSSSRVGWHGSSRWLGFGGRFTTNTHGLSVPSRLRTFHLYFLLHSVYIRSGRSGTSYIQHARAYYTGCIHMYSYITAAPPPSADPPPSSSPSSSSSSSSRS